MFRSPIAHSPRYSHRNRPQFTHHLRQYVLEYGVLLFTAVTAAFSARALGFFSPLLVYLPFMAVCVPIILAYDILAKTPRGPRFWCAFVWCLYMLLAPRYPASSHLNPSYALPVLPENGTYYIAANLFNSAAILPSWSREMFALVDYLGANNVFISIYESNSVDGTKQALGALKSRLERRGIRNSIIMEDNDARRGRWALNGHRRVHYMADARNKALEPLKEDGIYGRRYSKVLFFNDVYFDWRFIVHLLGTNGGAYDLACSMDFDGVGLYDVWVTRDVCGARTKEIWPYFSDPESVRRLRRNQPVEVASCWNGVAAFEASWLLPKPSSPPMRFRDNVGCSASECFLSSYDLHQATSPQRPRIFMNPQVKVAYDPYSFLFHTRLTHLSISWPWNWFYEIIGDTVFGWLVDRIWLQKQVNSESKECAAQWAKGWVKGENCAAR